MSKFLRDNPFGTVGTFRKVSDEIGDIEMHQKVDQAVASQTKVNNFTSICYKLWNVVWKGIVIGLILLLFGYGMTTCFGFDSGLSVSTNTPQFSRNAYTSTPLTEESVWRISTTIFVSQEAMTEATSEATPWITTTMLPETVKTAAPTTTDLPLKPKLKLSTTVRHPSTTTKWTIESMSEEERWDVRKRRPMYNPCARQLGDQVFMEVRPHLEQN